MNLRVERTMMTAAFAVLVGIIFILTLDLAPAARLVPLIVVLPTFVLLLLELAAPLVPWLRKAYQRLDEVDLYGLRRARKQSSTPGAGEAASRTSQELGVLLWFVVMLAVIYFLGLLAGLPLFVLLYLRLTARETWTVSVEVAAATCAFLYVLIALLGAHLYEGQIWQWLRA